MSDMIKVDVRGLSCPEPVLLTSDAIRDYPGKEICVVGDEAHTRTNIEKLLEQRGKEFHSEQKGSEYEITFRA